MKNAVLNNRQLRQERSEVLKEARLLSDLPTMTMAQKRKFDGLMADAQDLQQQYQEIERREAGASAGGGPPNGRVDGEERGDPRDREHRAAFSQFCRHGLTAMQPEARSLMETQYRDMQSGAGSGGGGAYPGSNAGFFIPLGMAAQIIDAMKWYGPFFGKGLDGAGVTATLETESGNLISYPANNDTNIIGERVSEGAQTTIADVSLSQLMIGAYKYSSRMVKVSNELLTDSAFDLEAFLTRMFANRIGRILTQDFTLGLGSTSQQPMGIVTATVNSGNKIFAVGSSTNDGGAAGTNSIGSDDFINLEHSVDPANRAGASYMMHDTTFAAVRRIKDKFGRPLWEPNLVAGQPSMINGYPVLLNQSMDSLQVAPGSPAVLRNTVLFGNLAQNYLIRRVKDMSIVRLSERFADYYQTAFMLWWRGDGQPLSAGAGSVFPFGILQNLY